MLAVNNYEVDLLGNTPGPAIHAKALELVPVLYPHVKTRRLAHPQHISRIPRATNIARAIAGAEWMGFPLTPQGGEVAALLNAVDSAGRVLYDELVALIARRAAKTTSIYADTLGLCATVPRSRCLVTAQDATRAREILRGTVMDDLEAAGFLRRGLAKFRYANGSEAIEWFNGSVIQTIPPKPSAFRSKAADRIIIDEAGELDSDLGHAIIAAALPLMDTRPNPQIIVAGTPPEEGEEGLLWDELGEALNPKAKRTAVLAYMLERGETVAVVDEAGGLTLDRSAIMRVHPGIGTVTDYRTILARFEKLTSRGRLDLFEREYACKFQARAGTTAIDLEAWRECGPTDVLPPRPDRIGLAYDVEPDGTYSALVAAWRDAEDVPHLELLGFDEGDAWLAPMVKKARARHHVPIAHDAIGANMDTANTLNRLRVPTTGVPLRLMIGATARLHREITKLKRLRHYCQPDLTAAVEGAVWRTIGESGRLYGRKLAGSPACPLVASAVALWQYDQIRRPTRATEETE